MLKRIKISVQSRSTWSSAVFVMGCIGVLSSCETPYDVKAVKAKANSINSEHTVPDLIEASPTPSPSPSQAPSPVPSQAPSPAPSQVPSPVPSPSPTRGPTGDNPFITPPSGTDPFPDLADRDPRQACEKLMAMGEPTIVYENKPVDTSVPDQSYSGITTSLSISAAETITKITGVSGDLTATARKIGHVSGNSGYMILNAVTFGDLTGASHHNGIVAKTIESLRGSSGNMYVSALSIGTIGNGTGNAGFTILVGRQSYGVQPKVDSIVSTGGAMLICGMDVGKITANTGAITIVGGDVGTAQSGSGALHVIDGEIGTIRGYAGSIKVE